MIEAVELTKGLTATSGPSTGFRSRSGRAWSPASSARTAPAQSTTMRLILGLDAPSTGDVTVNGKHYRDQSLPLHEVGALLEARSVHTGRSAYYHLLALAQTHGISQAPGRELIDLVGLSDVARRRRVSSRSGWASARDRDRAARRSRDLSARRARQRARSEGIHWIRNLLKALAAEGRTVFVSSHLMSEMALTADHLIVVGRGRLIADMSVEEFVRGASKQIVRVRSPQSVQLRELVLGRRDLGDEPRTRGCSRSPA